MSRRAWVAGVLVFALTGIAVRLAWIDRRLQERPRDKGWRLAARLEPPLSKAAWLHDEQLYYLSTAVNAFEGRGFLPDYNEIRDGVFVPPPMQSLLILAVLCARGGLVEPFTLLALQACLAGLMIVAAAELARRLGSAAAGLVCAALVALDLDFVLWTAYLLTESNYLVGFCLFSLLLVLWAERPSLPRAAAAAIVLGLINLQRPNAIWLPPVLALLALALFGVRRGLASAAALLLLPALVLVPWRQRNERLYGEPIWVSSNIGSYLYVANNPKLDVMATPYMDEANRGRRLLDPEIETRLRAPDGRLRVTYYVYSRAYLQAFARYVKAQPWHFTRNYVAKFLLQFWLVPDGEPLRTKLGVPAALHAGAQRLLTALGLCGLLLALRSRRSPALLALASVFAYLAAAGGLAGSDLAGRYGLVTRLLLLVFLAVGWEALRQRRDGRLQPAPSGAVAATGISGGSPATTAVSSK